MIEEIAKIIILHGFNPVNIEGNWGTPENKSEVYIWFINTPEKDKSIVLWNIKAENAIDVGNPESDSPDEIIKKSVLYLHYIKKYKCDACVIQGEISFD